MSSQPDGGVVLKRAMSRLDLKMAGLGAIIGSGWLFGGLYAANDAGPASVVGWVIGGVAVLLVGLVYAELSGMAPEAGGIARYPHFTHGSFVGFVMSWGAFIAYASVPAIEAEAVVQYAEHYIPSLANSSFERFVIEALLLLLFFAINAYGVKVFAKTNTIVTTLKFLTPGLTILVFLFVAKHWGNYTAAATGGFAPYGTSGILKAVATSGIVFAFLGFRQAVDLAGEAKNPQKDVPRAIIVAVVVAIFLYSLLETVFVAAIDPHGLGKGWASLNFTSPFAQVASAIGLGWLAVILYGDAVLSPAGTGNIYLASTARVMYAAANNRYLPARFRKLSERSMVPMLSLGVTAVAGIIFLLPFPSWQSLVGVISSATVFTYMIGPVSATVLRRTEPDAHRPFTLSGLPIIAPIAFVVGTLIIYWTGWSIDWKLIVALLIGAIVYGVVASRPNTQLDKVDSVSLKAGYWLIGYLVAMLAMSYFGSSNFGAPYNHGKGLIQYPWDLIVDAVLGVVFYYWGVASGIRTEDGTAAIANAKADMASRKAQEEQATRQ